MGLLTLDAGEGGKIVGTLRDANVSDANPLGVAIPKSAVSSIKLTLRDAASGAIVNSRDGQSVLDVNGGSMDATSGAFAQTFVGADTEVLDSNGEVEEHIAYFVADGTFVGAPLEWTHRIVCAQRLLLCTFEHVKLQRNDIPETDRLFVEMMIRGFTMDAEAFTGRRFRKSTTANPTVEVFSPDCDRWSIMLDRWPTDSIVSVKESETGDFDNVDPDVQTAITVPATEYAIGAEGILRMRNRPFADGVGSLQVKHAGGLLTNNGWAPDDLRAKAMRQVAYWHQRKRSLGVSGESLAGHSASFYATGDLLDDVTETLRRYRRKVMPV